jgi:uncharacterized protein HemX
MADESSNNSGNGGAFVAGVVVTGVLALILHNAGNQRHQKEIQQAYEMGFSDCRSQMQPAIYEKDMRIGQLEKALQQKDVQLGRKEADIESLTKAVESLSATVKAQELQQAAKIFPHDSDGNFGTDSN